VDAHMTFFRRLVAEPLLRFLLLGALLFAFFAWQGGGAGNRRIVITGGLIDHLAAGFARTWQRPPTEIELKGLIDDYVKEEIAAREAVAMGLDRDDTVIRRRLRQKLEFLLVDEAAAAHASDAELAAWMAKHADALTVEPELALRQVYVNPDRHGSAARADAERPPAQLRAAGPDAATDRLGDPSMLPPELPKGPLREVSRAFGPDFAEQLTKQEPGVWAGPLESPYGLHLVLVRERTAGGMPALAAVRPLVEREVQAERRAAARQALYDRFLAEYAVTVEKPVAASDRTGAASDKAGAASDKAGAASDKAGAASDKAGAASDKAGAASDKAGAASDKAGAASDKAGIAGGKAAP
jgi:hypothetical protein